MVRFPVASLTIMARPPVIGLRSRQAVRLARPLRTRRRDVDDLQPRPSQRGVLVGIRFRRRDRRALKLERAHAFFQTIGAILDSGQLLLKLPESLVRRVAPGAAGAKQDRRQYRANVAKRPGIFAQNEAIHELIAS
jgi:hypothetical protein